MKPIQLLLWVSLFLLYKPASAQTVVKGVVTGNKSKPVYGVSISIKDSYDGATTDSLGRFSFTTAETGEQLLQATAVGYKPFSQSLKLQGQPITLSIA